jgi:hypothetical protein
MTEAEWLACTDPQLMLNHLDGRVGNRKVRLLRVGAARSVWAVLTDERYRAAVEVGERYADDRATDDELRTHNSGLYGMFGPGGEFARGRTDQAALALYSLALSCVNSPRALSLAGGASWSVARRYTHDRLPEIVRDLFGNPFHPVSADPSWLTSTVVTLAESIYEERAFDRLPILADALEVAGCDDADVLAHCRGDGPHVRGCWVVDLVLGKS